MTIPPTEETICQRASAQKSLSALLDSFSNGELTRESFLDKVTQLLELEPAAPDLQPVTLDHLTIKVPDLEQSSRFYQDVLGMPLLRALPDTHYLGVGDSFMGIQPSGSDQAYIDHFCLGLKNFNAGDILARLAQQGISIEGEAGSDSLRFFDPHGLLIQLSSTDYARKETQKT